MRVRELIAALQRLDSEAEVLCWKSDGADGHALTWLDAEYCRMTLVCKSDSAGPARYWLPDPHEDRRRFKHRAVVVDPDNLTQEEV